MFNFINIKIFNKFLIFQDSFHLNAHKNSLFLMNTHSLETQMQVDQKDMLYSENAYIIFYWLCHKESHKLNHLPNTILSDTMHVWKLTIVSPIALASLTPSVW